MDKKRKPEMPVWSAVLILCAGAGLVGTMAYFNIEYRYAILGIAMLGSSSLVASGIIVAVRELIRHWRTHDVIEPHQFETNPPEAELWKDQSGKTR